MASLVVQKPWKAEYAKSSRSSCKTCKTPIDKEVLRLGKMVQATQFDGFMPMWNHASCILKKAKQIKSIDDVEGIELLRWEDQQKIRKYVEGGGPSTPDTSAVPTAQYGIEVSQTSRATCKHCSQKIMKGEVRISTKPDGQGARGLTWNHANCFLEQSPSTQVEKLSGWESLSASDQAVICALTKKVPSTAKSGTKVEIQENKELLQQSTSKAGVKRKKEVSGDQKPKAAKAIGQTSASTAACMENVVDSRNEHSKASDLESKLETQTKELWALKDDLKKYVSTAELREMLEANGQELTGSELDLRERCADGMMFGALATCPLCSGSLCYSGGMYRCRGFLSAWSKCSYSTREPERLKGKWKVPEETNNQYLSKWFRSQKGTKPVRILPTSSSNNPSGSQATNSPSQSTKSESLGDLRVAVSGIPKESMEEFKRKIEGAGGSVHTKIKKEEKSEKKIMSEPHGMVFDFEAVKMTESVEQNKSEIEEIGNAASHTRQPEVIQVEEMQPQALSTLKPQGVVFDVETVKIVKPSGQMEFQIEDDDMEPEASEQHGLYITQGSEKSEKQIVSEPHGMVFDVKTVTMTDSGEQNKSEIEEIWNVASHTRQPEVIQSEGMQPQALSTLKPQGVVFDDEAVKILKPSGQMEFQIEDNDVEPEASEQLGLFITQGGLVFTKPTKDEDWKHAKEIYLMDNELSVLPENPRCLNLSALFLPRNYKLRVIPPSFFDYMPTLQILNLSRTGIKSLPDSLFQLVSLERLFLNDCHRLMMLSPKVGDLEKLEVLDLEGAKIINLPKEIKKLTNLICLEVSFYGYTGNGRRSMQSNAVVPCGVICSLSQLEELNIDVNPDDERWDTLVEDIVNEVCNLKRLETFKFYFPRVELLRHFQWNSLSLSHFRFTVGHHVKRIMSRVPLDVEFELERWERCLKYINGVGVPRDIKNVLQHATAFFLDRHATVKKLSDFGTRNMKQIKCCVVGECNEVQMIIDTADAFGEDGISEIVSESHGAERIVLGSLEYLCIYYMKSLRSIWEGPVPQNSLYLLKSLTLRTCPQLTTIFTQELLDNLCSLEELKVEDCPSIKSIVSCKIPAEHRTSYFLPNLKKISLHYMLGLVSISSGLHIAPKLEWLSFYNCPSLSNPLINEVSSHDLKKIKGERSWWEALEWSNGRPDYLDEIFVPIDIWDC